MWRKRLRQHRHKPFLLMLAPEGITLTDWVQGEVLILIFTDPEALQHCIRQVRRWRYRRMWRGVVLVASGQALPSPSLWRTMVESVVQCRVVMPCWVWLVDVPNLPPETAWVVPCQQGVLGGMQSLLATLRQQMPLRCQWYDSPQDNSRIPAVVPNIIQQMGEIQQWLDQVWVKATWHDKVPLQAVLLDAQAFDLKRQHPVVQACLQSRQVPGKHRWQQHLALGIGILGSALLLWMLHATYQQWQAWDSALLHAQERSLTRWQQHDAQLRASQWSLNHRPYDLWHAAYQQRLLTTFLPHLLAVLHHALHTHPSFTALKLYLMLSTGKHLDPAWVMAHVSRYWQPDWQRVWLRDSLALPHYPGISDLGLVKKLRRHWPIQHLVQVMWQAIVKRSAHTPAYVWLQATEPGASAFVTHPLTVPGLFSASGYQQLFDPQRQQQIADMAKSMWVFGQEKPASMAQQKQWREALTQRYWQAYALHWQNVLSQVQLTPFGSVDMAVFRLRQFAQATAIWSRLYARLVKQTLHLPHFVTGLHKTTWQQWHKVMQHLLTVLVTLQDSGQRAQASWQLAKQLLGKQPPAVWQSLHATIASLPMPLNSWLGQIRQQVLHAVVAEGLAYAKQQWQQQVLAYYQQNLAPYFPFNGHAQQGVGMGVMLHFFAPHSGIVAQFIEQDIAPFVQTDTTGHIQWQQRDGQAISSDTHWLKQLQTLLLWQQGFVQQGKIHGTFVVQWHTLSHVARVSLQWGKQHWHAEGEQTTWRVPWLMHTVHALLWRINPGWLHKDSQQQWQGPWAAWRWLHSAKVVPGPHQWHLTFSTHGHHVAGEVWVTPQNRAIVRLLFDGAPHVLS